MGINIDDNIEIGDFFKIKRNEYNHNCKALDKVFQVISESKSKLSVYYYDGRTNIKCKCQRCNSYSQVDKKMKCIGKTDIELYKKYKHHLREIKLKKILN